MLLAAEFINYLSLVFGAGALAAAGVSLFKAPTEKDVAKRAISVDEAAEIRNTLNDALDQAQEDRDGARSEARLVRKELQDCHGLCDQVQAENSELKAKLRAADTKIARLERKVAELEARLEAL